MKYFPLGVLVLIIVLLSGCTVQTVSDQAIIKCEEKKGTCDYYVCKANESPSIQGAKLFFEVAKTCIQLEKENEPKK